VALLGEFVSYGMVAGPDSASLLHQPSRAIMQAAEKAGLAIGDLEYADELTLGRALEGRRTVT
jgi:acetyl-CoA C-acetyltransferase